MSHEYYRRGRNWYTAIGALFLIMAGIVLARQLLIWGPEFMTDFLLNSEITNEKVSAVMIGFGVFMIVLGFKKHEQPR
ncbi:MAG: hypothetical protein OEM18_05845 [Nitrosopumilus sp.]|jgi:multisubunit Na+/H+ antiporter MnhB subunit|nr:hypothetical protein [Nitrosopumilus sp.]MDH3501665.1 hypothetical protein [Nitrosopumilus sp.]